MIDRLIKLYFSTVETDRQTDRQTDRDRETEQIILYYATIKSAFLINLFLMTNKKQLNTANNCSKIKYDCKKKSLFSKLHNIQTEQN